MMRARRLRLLLGALLGALNAASCGLDWTLSLPDAGSGSPGGPEGGSDGSDGGPGPPKVCGRNSPCPAGTFCHFPDHECGTQGSGECIPPRSGCDADVPPDPYVCQCNLKSEMNECVANANGQDLSVGGNCGGFPFEWICGYVYCGGFSGPPDCERTTVDGEAKYDCLSPPGCALLVGCSSCPMSGCSCTDVDGGGKFYDCGP